MTKIEFLKQSAMRNSYNAAIQQSKLPVYALGADKEKLRAIVAQHVIDIAQPYTQTVDDIDHCHNITLLADRVSSAAGGLLHNDRFRIGTAQKVLNLYLKYLWCYDLIVMPPHCPIDNQILIKAKVTGVRWTTVDSIEQYKDWIKKIRNVAGKQLIAQWELTEWKWE